MTDYAQPDDAHPSDAQPSDNPFATRYVRPGAQAFLFPGDEDLAAATVHTRLSFGSHAWDELDLAPEDCDVVFAYPWPGEEACVDGVFARHAAPGALLLTFHGWDHVLVQRKLADEDKLMQLGWM